MILEKPGLFTTRREFLLGMLLLVLIILGRLGWEYQAFSHWVSQPFVYTHATIVTTYPKQRNGKNYTVLRLRTPSGQTLYTTAYREDLQRGEDLYLQLFPGAQLGYWDYLGGMYCKSRIKRVSPAVIQTTDALEAWIGSQHSDADMQAFYQGIFLATPIPKTLRSRIAALGVSHLVALSGFHLGILWAVLYGVLLLLYRPLQQRYFPWRYALKDVGLMVIVMLGGYLWLTGAPPSLLRSYAMLLVGWTMVLMGIDLLSFTFLTTITFLLLALFPPLIASLGFWLSIAGVFYIFLLLHYCHAAHKWVISLLCIPVGIFVLMQPLVHGIFPLTNQGQLLSPLLSIGFIVFYPLAFVLHMIGHGGALDGLLISLFALPATSEEHLLPVWAVASYLVLSVGAIWRRELFGILVVVAMGYGIYLFGH